MRLWKGSKRKGMAVASAVIFIAVFPSIILLSSLAYSQAEGVEDVLLEIASEDPGSEVTVILVLETDNEGLLDEIDAATAEIDQELDKIEEEFKSRFRSLKEELGYSSNKEEILRLFREGDKDFMERLATLEEKHGLGSESRLKAGKYAEMKRAEKNNVIMQILRERYEPIQEYVISELGKFDSADILFQDVITNKIIVRAKAGHVPKMAGIDGVHEIISGEWEDVDESDVSVPTIGAPTWHSNGYDGSPLDILFINSNGILVTHTSLDHIPWRNNCFISAGCSATAPSSGHDTVVAGIIGSDHQTYRGVSYGLDDFYNARTSTFSQAISAVSWAIDGIPDDADHITMSKSFGGSNPPYCGDTVQEEYVDEVVDLLDVNWVKSAGNKGGTSNENVTNPGGAYNIIASGASDDQNTASRADDVIWSGSSRGPVEVCGSSETRIKPDITAPGRSITSTAETGGFSTWTGTSFSAPHVAGSLLLIHSRVGSLAGTMEMRALMFNTAEDRGFQGPDNEWGYGYLDMSKAYFEFDNMDELTVTGQESSVFLWHGPVFQGERVTTVWNRHIVSNNGVTNNLDLFIYDEGSNILIDSSQFVGRNIEQVSYSQDSSSGVVKVKLQGLNTGTGEDFGIAANSQLTAALPPSFSVLLILPDSASCNEIVNVTAGITNVQGSPHRLSAHDVTADLELPPGFLVVSGPDPQNIGTIPGGSTGMAEWSVQVGGSGNQVLSAGISSLSYGEMFTGTTNTGTITVGSAEVCDGIDNDCDGRVDEGCPLGMFRSLNNTRECQFNFTNSTITCQ